MSTIERVLLVFNAVFEGKLASNTITAESRLREDIGINSIGMLYMAMALETEFSIKFRNEDFVSIVTVGDVIACIEGKLKR